MKHFKFLLLLAGAFIITACAGTETVDESSSEDTAAESTPASTDTSKPESSATTTETKPESAATTTGTSTPASSDDSGITYICKHDGSTRIIRVLYPDEGPVCEVTYEKSSGTQSLWNAQNDKTYCEDKAIEFVTKQESWGWSCAKQ